jgi:hypothetical protein
VWVALSHVGIGSDRPLAPAHNRISVAMFILKLAV